MPPFIYCISETQDCTVYIFRLGTTFILCGMGRRRDHPGERFTLYMTYIRTYVHTVLYNVHNVLCNAHIGGGGCDRGKNISSSYFVSLDINFWSEFLSFRPSNYPRGFHQFPCLFCHIIQLFSHISLYTMLAIAKRLNEIG